ncbi:MAG TPA: hypothetical protein DEB06_10780 [Phycisphaerales bacterium]|nr:hypothetical protein [Phycisphaerales bacterium]
MGDEGVVVFSARRIEALGVLEQRADRAVILSDGVALQYSRATSEGGRTVQLSAERAVVFLTDDTEPGLPQYPVRAVKGVYLEGGVVAQSGDYTLRGARVYYDLRTERAIVLDAVFWTYDEKAGMPLYMRADAIRQESDRQWSAKDVRLANVGFAEPHFAIGATSVTITQRAPAPGESGPAAPYVDAEGVGFLVGGTRTIGLPSVRGELKPTPLRRVDIGSRGGDPIVRTAWDLYTALGLDAAEGNEALLLIDGYFSRGPAAGLDLSWSIPDIRGSLYAWGIYDDGHDRLPSGALIEHDNEFRGVAEFEQVWKLNERWTLFLEGAYASDETLLPAFFPGETRTRREFTSSIYARHLDERSLFSIEGRNNFNDFTPNDYLLQSLGYNTQRLPEVSYTRVGDSLFNGLLSYSSEYRYSRVALNFTEPTARELGFKTTSDARRALGLAPNQSPADRLRAEGLFESAVNRFDTRHEFSAPLASGPLNIVPFGAGRVTAWDEDFDDFNNGALDEEYRLWGSLGVRLATTIQRIDDRVRSEFFDLQRIRHIIEPSATLWTAGSTIAEGDLPVYDDGVESISRGSAARAGVRNTFQTQRGGPGNRRSVDWLILDTNYVWSSEDVDIESPIGRFIEFRPEGSNLGEFVANDALMQLTDAVALTNTVIYDIDENTLARLTAGVLFDHGYGFSSFFDYRTTDALSTSLLDFGVRYELTRKYAAAVFGTADFDDADLQEMTTRVERRFPQWTLEFEFGVDTISSDVSLGLFLRPAGIAGETRSRVFTRDLTDPAKPVIDPTGGDRLDRGPFAGVSGR